MTLIDKIAWIRLQDGKILSTRSRGKDELIWLTYADRDRVSPVDQLIFDHIHQNSQLT